MISELLVPFLFQDELLLNLQIYLVYLFVIYDYYLSFKIIY